MTDLERAQCMARDIRYWLEEQRATDAQLAEELSLYAAAARREGAEAAVVKLKAEAVSEVRDEALEEAAVLCLRKVRDHVIPIGQDNYHDGCISCASAIRALKDRRKPCVNREAPPKLEEEWEKMATATMVPNPALMIHRVSAGPYTLALPTNGVAILYEDGKQLPGGVGYLSALVQFAGEVIRLNAEIVALREIAARPSSELHALTKERDEARDAALEAAAAIAQRTKTVAGRETAIAIRALKGTASL